MKATRIVWFGFILQAAAAFALPSEVRPTEPICKIAAAPATEDFSFNFYEPAESNVWTITPEGSHRLSIDPTGNFPRVPTRITLSNLTTKISQNYDFGMMGGIPLNAGPLYVEGGPTYSIRISLLEFSAPVTYRIGLDQGIAQVRFDPNATLGGLSSLDLYNTGLCYTDGAPYGYFPEPIPHDSATAFLGWATNRTDAAILKESDLASASTPMLYARWRYTYSAILHEAEAGGRTETLALVSDEPKNLTNSWTRAGWELYCWTNAVGTVFAAGATVTNLLDHPGEVHLYACWRDRTTCIEFDANGGTGSMSPVSYAYDEGLTLPACTFSRVGYTFDGWATNATASALYQDHTPQKPPFEPCTTNTLYAVWEREGKDTILIDVPAGATFVTNSIFSAGWKTLFQGALAAGATKMIEVSNTASEGTELRLSLDPRTGLRTGLSATVEKGSGASWTLVATVSDLQSDEVRVPFAAGGVYRIKLDGSSLTEAYDYAFGVGYPGVQTTYDLDGGTLTGPLATFGTNFIYTANTPVGYLPEATPPVSKKADGWYRGSAVCREADAVGGSETIIRAKWRPLPFDYTVAFSNDVTDVSGTMGSVTATYDTKAHLPSNAFTRTGYIFREWKGPNNQIFADGAAYSNLTETIGAVVTLTARWAGNSYSVRLNANGGEGTAPSVQVMTYGQSAALTANPYIKPGFDFVGWARVSETNVAEWVDRAVVSNLTTTAGATVDLYAVWRPSAGVAQVVTIPEETQILQVECVSNGAAALFLGMLSGTCHATNFIGQISTNSEDFTCRVSLDPVTGTRVGAILTVSAESNKVYQTIATISDRATNATMITFRTGVRYGFNVSGVNVSSTNSYRYVIGLGLEGVDITFDPHRVAASDKTAQLRLNASVGYPYGWSPTLVQDSTNGVFQGWYDSPVIGQGTKLDETKDLVKAERTLFHARWSNQKWKIDFDWNLTGEDLVTIIYTVGGTNDTFGTVRKGLTQPTNVVGSVTGWYRDRACSGEKISDSFIIASNMTVYAKWCKDYVLSGGGAAGWTIESCTGSVPALLQIPSEIDGTPVTGIGDSAFEDSLTLRMVVLPSSVHSVGASAFAGCQALEKVVWPTEEPEEDAESGYLEEEVLVGASAFANCRALTSCEVPLGVKTLSDEMLSGCWSLRGFTIPFTVTEIGEAVFAGCSAITNLTVTELTKTIGARAFAGCMGMSSIWYLGDAPEADVTIYDETAKKFYSRHYTTNEKDGSAAGWPAGRGAFWPEGDRVHRTATLTGAMVPRTTVTFVMDEKGLEKVKKAYVLGRPFGLLAEESEGGWWTKPIGGTRIGPYRKVTAAMKVYRHKELGSGEEGARTSGIGWDDGFFDESEEAFKYKNGDYRGLVLDAEGRVAGSITVRTTAATPTPHKDRRVSPVRATAKLLGVGKDLVFSGKVLATGAMSAKSGKYELAAEGLTVAGFNGTISYDGEERYTVRCCNQYATSVKANISLKRALTRGNWALTLKTGEIEDLGGAAWAEGYSTLLVNIGTGGKSKIDATMADGTSVSVAENLIYGDGFCCLPIIVPLYSGKTGGFACALWITWQSDLSIAEGDVSIRAPSIWDAAKSRHPFRASFDEENSLALQPPEEAITGTLLMDLGPIPVADGRLVVEDGLLPRGMTFSVRNSVWIFPSPDRVRFEGGAWQDLSPTGANPSGIRLHYAKDTGRFCGTFAVRCVNAAGNPISYVAAVTGAFARPLEGGDDVVRGFGTATIPVLGSMPVTIEFTGE